MRDTLDSFSDRDPRTDPMRGDILRSPSGSLWNALSVRTYGYFGDTYIETSEGGWVALGEWRQKLKSATVIHRQRGSRGGL